MRTARHIAFFLCTILIAALLCQAAAAEGLGGGALTQAASELSQYTSLKYFKSENTQRYIDYRGIHPELTWEIAITYVNIGLDTYFYTNATVVADPGAASVLVNKYRPLPSDFVPARLEVINPLYSFGTQKLAHAARVAFEKMSADAKGLGYSISATSAYRSYSKQLSVYNSFLIPGDPSSAVTQELTAARPGFSEHQTGLALDIVGSSTAQTTSIVTKWYAKNAYKYGFIIRYPYGKEPILGYTNEPWHLRYLGVTLATAVYKSGLTYDEYYEREIDIPAKNADTRAVGVTAASGITVGATTVRLSTYDVLGSRYYRLRDIAAVLNGTLAQFDIAWDAATGKIELLAGTAYSGDPVLVSFDPDHAALVTAVKPSLLAYGIAYDLSAYSSGGSSYFKLEDILKMLGMTAADDGQGGLVLDATVVPPTPEPSPTPSDAAPVPAA